METGVQLHSVQDWLSRHAMWLAALHSSLLPLHGYRKRVESPHQSWSSCGDVWRGQSQITVFP